MTGPVMEVRLTLVGRGRSRKGPTTIHAFLGVGKPR